LRLWSVVCGLWSILGAPALAGTLPDERVDMLYHRYDGGGVTIDGPSILVRKNFADKVSVAANYYVDMVSSASIDVIATASPYEEERTQWSIAADYLSGSSTYSAGFINSEESDYVANTWFAAVTQSMFGDLTTVTMHYKQGANDIYRNISGVRDPGFAQDSKTRTWGVSLSQVITKNMLGSFNFDVISDEGYLNSPYRSVRYVDPTAQNGYSYQAEIYPETRTSNALSTRLAYFLPYRAVIAAWYRYYNDSWGIVGNTGDLTYTQPVGNRWVFAGSVRYYTQTSADFYSDLFPRRDYANFLARDKELASYTAVTLGAIASYAFNVPRAPWIKRAEATVRYDFMTIDYDDFHDVTQPAAVPGTEPLYSLDANIFQAIFSIWF